TLLAWTGRRTNPQSKACLEREKGRRMTANVETNTEPHPLKKLVRGIRLMHRKRGLDEHFGPDVIPELFTLAQTSLDILKDAPEAIRGRIRHVMGLLKPEAYDSDLKSPFQMHAFLLEQALLDIVAYASPRQVIEALAENKPLMEKMAEAVNKA